MRKCEACGTTKNLGPSLGGVLLCRDHYHDISAQVEQIRAEGKQVNVAGMARQMFREQYSTGNYIVRDIPKKLWDNAKQRAFDDGVSLRELVLTAIQKHLNERKAIDMTTQKYNYMTGTKGSVITLQDGRYADTVRGDSSEGPDANAALVALLDETERPGWTATDETLGDLTADELQKYVGQ